MKVVIQCAKLLNNVESAKFYPEKFIAICDIFEVFSKLVFRRLKGLAYNPDPNANLDNIPDSSIRPELISDAAKETCTNWFLKTAIIREIVPRWYCFVALTL